VAVGFDQLRHMQSKIVWKLVLVECPAAFCVARWKATWVDTVEWEVSGTANVDTCTPFKIKEWVRAW
jgi:hypothetical protein